MKRFTLLTFLLLVSGMLWAQEDVTALYKFGYGQDFGGLGGGMEIKAGYLSAGFGLGVFPSNDELDTESAFGGAAFLKAYFNNENFNGLWAEVGYGQLGVYRSWSTAGDDTGTLSILGFFGLVGYTIQMDTLCIEGGLGYAEASTVGDIDVSDLPSSYRSMATLQLSMGWAYE